MISSYIQDVIYGMVSGRAILHDEKIWKEKDWQNC